MTCPAAVTTVSPSNTPIAVTFQAPVTTGTPPVTASCVPASGSLFPIGTTAVSCSATVTSSQRLSCSFNVTVSPPPMLSRTKVVAFGDSITFGSGHFCSGLESERWTPATLLLPFVDPPPTAYPNVLLTMLRERYTAQTPVMINAGFPGESANDGETRRRFTRTLNENTPEVLLLQEGINDLHAFESYGIPPAQGITNLVRALRDMALDARSRNVRVFLGTLLPQRPNGCRAYAIPPRGDTDLITPTNAQIRAMATVENIDLVDLAARFEGQIDTLIGQDGLHPTTAGYASIATAFYDAIRQRLETPSGQ
jgi:lysophospholipase L1-like esterase